MNRPLEAHFSSSAPASHSQASETVPVALAGRGRGLAASEAEDRLRRRSRNRIERSRGESALPLHGCASSPAEAQTLNVTTNVLFHIFCGQNCRPLRESVLSVGLVSNPVVFVGVGALLVLQVLLTEPPALQAPSGTASLDAEAWLDCAAVAATILPVIAVAKWLWRRAGLRPPGQPNHPASRRGGLS